MLTIKRISLHRALVQFFLDLTLVKCFKPSQQSARLLLFALPLSSRNHLGETRHRGCVEQAAQREAREETGLSGIIVTKIDTIKYSYVAKWEKPTIRVFKIVTFYLLKYTEGDPSQHDREVDRVEWFPIEKAISSATYPQEKTILRKAKQLIAAEPEDRT